MVAVVRWCGGAAVQWCGAVGAALDWGVLTEVLALLFARLRVLSEASRERIHAVDRQEK